MFPMDDMEKGVPLCYQFNLHIDRASVWKGDKFNKVK